MNVSTLFAFAVIAFWANR